MQDHRACFRQRERVRISMLKLPFWIKGWACDKGPQFLPLPPTRQKVPNLSLPRFWCKFLSDHEGPKPWRELAPTGA